MKTWNKISTWIKDNKEISQYIGGLLGGLLGFITVIVFKSEVEIQNGD